MPKDGITARRVKQNMGVLQAAGVPTAEIKCKEMKLDEHFFSTRMTSVTPRLSQEIFRALQEPHIVNKEDICSLCTGRSGRTSSGTGS